MQNKVTMYSSSALANNNRNGSILISPKPSKDEMDFSVPPTTKGLWKTEPTLPLCVPSTSDTSVSQTPHLLSSTNSITSSSIRSSPKTTKRGKKRKRLFGQYLTYQSIGAVPPKKKERGYILHRVDLKQPHSPLPSQDVLTLNPHSVLLNPAPTILQLKIPPSVVVPSYRKSRTSVHFASSQRPTLHQLKKALKSKLQTLKTNENGRKRKRVTSAPKPNVELGQERKVIDLKTGNLYLYCGGEMARKAVFVRTR